MSEGARGNKKRRGRRGLTRTEKSVPEGKSMSRQEGGSEVSVNTGLEKCSVGLHVFYFSCLFYCLDG